MVPQGVGGGEADGRSDRLDAEGSAAEQRLRRLYPFGDQPVSRRRDQGRKLRLQVVLNW